MFPLNYSEKPANYMINFIVEFFILQVRQLNKHLTLSESLK